MLRDPLMRPFLAISCRAALAALPLLLTGCGVPGAIAQGVKSVENSHTGQPPTPAAPEPPKPVRKSHGDAPPPAVAAPPPAVVSAQPLAPPSPGQ